MIKRYLIHIEDEDVCPVENNQIGNWIKWEDVELIIHERDWLKERILKIWYNGCPDPDTFEDCKKCGFCLKNLEKEFKKERSIK